MKPYKLGKVWIDLDSVQSISDPKMCGNWSIEIYVDLAFERRTKTINFTTDATHRVGTVSLENFLKNWDFTSLNFHSKEPWEILLMKESYIVELEMGKFMNELYNPFLHAWINRDAS